MPANTLDLEAPLAGTQFGAVTGFTVPKIITTGINIALILAAVGFFAFLVMGAMQWISSGGDKEGVEKARKKITSALIGLTILFSVYALALLSQTIFGVNILAPLTIPSI